MIFNLFFISEHEFKIYITLIAINVLCARSANKLLYVVGDDPVIRGLSLLQLWKKPVTLGPGHVRTIEDI